MPLLKKPFGPLTHGLSLFCESRSQPGRKRLSMPPHLLKAHLPLLFCLENDHHFLSFLMKKKEIRRFPVTEGKVSPVSYLRQLTVWCLAISSKCPVPYIIIIGTLQKCKIKTTFFRLRTPFSIIKVNKVDFNITVPGSPISSFPNPNPHPFPYFFDIILYIHVLELLICVYLKSVSSLPRPYFCKTPLFFYVGIPSETTYFFYYTLFITF